MQLRFEAPPRQCVVVAKRTLASVGIAGLVYEPNRGYGRAVKGDALFVAGAHQVYRGRLYSSTDEFIKSLYLVSWRFLIVSRMRALGTVDVSASSADPNVSDHQEEGRISVNGYAAAFDLALKYCDGVKSQYQYVVRSIEISQAHAHLMWLHCSGDDKGCLLTGRSEDPRNLSLAAALTVVRRRIKRHAHRPHFKERPS